MVDPINRTPIYASVCTRIDRQALYVKQLELLGPENYEAEAKAHYAPLNFMGRVLRSNTIFFFVP